MRRAAPSGLAAGMIVLGSVGAIAAGPTHRAPVTHQVVIDKMAFGTVPTDARVGDTIIWINHDMFRHTVTAQDHSFDVDLAPGRSAAIKLDRKGNFAFFCRYHPGMKGMLSVSN